MRLSCRHWVFLWPVCPKEKRGKCELDTVVVVVAIVEVKLLVTAREQNGSTGI